MNHPIKTGLLAYGTSGKLFHTPFLHAHPGFGLYSVTERHQQLAVANYPEIKTYATVDEHLRDPEVELIIINTPNNTHFDYGMQALMAGKHILIEKPFATSVLEANTLFELGKKLNLKVLAYQNRRLDSDFLSVKQVLESGRLGRLVEVHFRFDRYRLAIGPKQFKETDVPGSGILYDLGSHLVDQAIALFGNPIYFQQQTGIYRPNSQVDDYVFIRLSYPDDLQVYIFASMLVAKQLPAFVLNGIHGSYIKERTDVQEDQLRSGVLPDDENYGLEKDGLAGQLTIVNTEGEKTTEYLPALKGDYMGIFDAVYQTIRENAAFPVAPEAVITQMSILENSQLV
ncbi:MAG: Gfo/Idh/MocA family protein [Sphingobacteriaceae bacterium]